jgi:hypothetical protein
MRPVHFTGIAEEDFHTSETIKIEFKTQNVIKLNSWLLYVYHAICGVLGLVTIFALLHISTVNADRFWMLLGADIIAFGIGAALWVGRR